MLPEQTPALSAVACANCGAPVTGRFCSNCGQRAGHALPTVGHFLLESAEDLSHADSRLWVTLWALLFKPGFLTREFLSGRRARYLPPLRLYLVVSVVFFIVAGSQQHEVAVIQVQTGDHSHTTVMPLSEYGPLRALPGETQQQHEARVCQGGLDHNMSYAGPGSATLRRVALKACVTYLRDGPEPLVGSFLHNMPRAMFLFLPLLALVMMLMYWHPRRYYVEHLLFFVHNHAFLFVLFTLVSLVSLVAPALNHSLSDLATLYVIFYFFVSMRHVYGQGRWPTAIKLASLSIAYLFCALMMFALTTAYTLLTL